MSLRTMLAAVAAATLSTAGLALPTAEAAPVVGARVCTTRDSWNFSPPLTLTPRLLAPGTASGSYTATCPRYIVDTAAPYLVTGVQGPYSLGFSYNYVGNCAAAVLTGGATHTGVIIGGMVAVIYSASVGTFHNLSVKVLTPSPDVCSESSASGTGYTVGTLP
ncbi:MAG TPA: hypothetical protein VNA20_11250 [Frankiaceae bacterium]|nr:hypothetical protein [Frankiaceae bacterium]